jgi:putative sigma-54 modulation protein
VLVRYAQSSGSTTTKEALMRLQVKGKNVEVTPSIREYAERKLAKLEKQLAEPTQVELELSEQRNPSIADSQVAEATVFTKGPTLRAREATSDMKASIDQLVDKLDRQVKRYRERRIVEPRRHTEHNGVEPRYPEPHDDDEDA